MDFIQWLIELLFGYGSTGPSSIIGEDGEGM